VDSNEWLIPLLPAGSGFGPRPGAFPARGSPPTHHIHPGTRDTAREIRGYRSACKRDFIPGVVYILSIARGQAQHSPLSSGALIKPNPAH
jgi:hypothetical protein